MSGASARLPRVLVGLPSLLVLLLSSTSARAELVVAGAEEEEPDPFTPIAERQFGLATATMSVRALTARDSIPSGLSSLFLAGLSARAVVGKRIGYGVGLGFEFGASSSPGFAFGCDLYPAGVAVAIGPTGYFGAFFGLGVNGSTSRLPYAFVLPMELRLEVDWTKRARLGAIWQIAFTPTNDARADGSSLFPFADESLLGVSARFGKTFQQYRTNMGRGYWIRLERRELLKTVFLGASFGVEIDVAH